MKKRAVAIVLFENVEELARDLREKAVRLNIDGMGTPGRLSAKEVELEKLLALQFDLARQKDRLQNAAASRPAGADAKALDREINDVRDRVDSVKQDLGSLNNGMNDYLAKRDDEKATRELLRQVNEQLDQISQNVNSNPPEVRWLCHPSRG